MFVHSGHVMTLANSIIGVGILAMPFCFQKCGIVLAILLVIVSNWITRICCHYLIKCSLLTRRKSFEFLGFHAFGTSGKLLVELCIIGYLLGTCITYFVVVGDLGPQIVTKMLSLDNPHVHLRTWIMIAVTLVCILPLGMLKNVDSLSTVCTASIGFYVCLVLKIVLESEDHILASDWTEQVKYWEPAGMLQCLPIFSMALSCQMQLFEVFESINNQSLEKLNGIVKNATWICTFVYIAVGFFGYVAFCTQAFSGNILINLSESFGSDVIKIGFVLSVAFSFPLVIFPCRASIYSLLYRKGHTDATGYIPETRFKVITTVIVGIALSIALMIPSVELIIGLVGSTIGVAICIMFPAACFRKIVKKETTERSLAQFILVSGFCLMILGTYANLNAIDVKRSGAHLEAPEDIEEILNLPTAMPEIKIEPVIKEVEVNNLSQAEQIEEEQINIPESIKKLEQIEAKRLNVDKSDEKPISVEKPSPPPLPVDEAHDADEEIKLDKKPQSSAELIAKEPIIPEVMELEIVPLAANQTQSSVLAKNNNKRYSLTTAQSINSDAINKDEEIAAEELKNDKTVKLTANDELKKTQNELKKTKELLQRTVGELKEELAKQNKQTQNLVAEKLGQVVEKVEKIEREVHQKEAQEEENVQKVQQLKQETLNKDQEINEFVEQVKQVESEIKNEKLEKQDAQENNSSTSELGDNNKKVYPSPDTKRRNKGSLISILAEENVQVNPPEDKLPAKPKVYEPISYKTGEIVENVRNAINLEQRLRLPLPLLINASTSQDKANHENLKAKLTQAASKPEPKNNPKGHITLNRNEEQNELNQPQNKIELKMKKLPDDAEDAKKLQKENETDKENIDAIRRDLLQLKSFQLDESSPTLQEQQRERVKRSSVQLEQNQMNIKDLPQQLDPDNCLSSVKVEKMLTMGVKNTIDFNTGRQLKANENQDNN